MTLVLARSASRFRAAVFRRVLAAHRADVGEPAEQQHERDRKMPARPPPKNSHREEAAEHPDELEARLEPRRTRARAPRRRRRAARGCRTRGERAPMRRRRRIRRTRARAGRRSGPRRTAGSRARPASPRGSTPRAPSGAATARSRSRVALPSALPTSTSPNTHAGSPCFFSTNAAKNVKKPTTPRSSPIAVPAVTMLGTCSSSRSSRSRAARPASHVGCRARRRCRRRRSLHRSATPTPRSRP